MNNSTVNFTTPEASTNSTTQSIGLLDSLEICVYSISFLFGLPTHIYVIWLIITGAGSGVASEFFILNFSISEAGFCVNCLTFVLSVWFSFIVQFKLFLVGLITTGRPLFQSLICVERYLAVVHPVTFLKYKPLRYRVICCTVVWIIIFGSCLCCMYTIDEHNIVHMWFLSLQFLLFFFIQLFCLVAVLRALKQSGPGERGRARVEENYKKRRAFYLILITTVTMVITYIPYSIGGFFTIARTKLIPAYWFPGLVCYVLSGFVQPVLYLHRTGKLSCPVSYKTCYFNII
ncbi:uracil nucleotide/cysteinyl leukotriene receptor-like [Megalobrama amblycephala]|uniref:uracil nucleotide/cysteinyl leukotriene receptor-like n=1 Tax=Megalobrama amblycephala TaxID=75352 RepID=UPI00201435C9|nr:uracil nucleotide/cysteinyl leukotriene receptor-like [Megalobrama amblycephala]